jgi:hypothetical protein
MTDQQEAQIKAFVKQNDIASAQKVILGELATQMGGTARAAADTYIGRTKQMRNAVGDLAEAVGSWFTPSLKEAAETMTAIVEPITNALNNIQKAYLRASIGIQNLNLKIYSKDSYEYQRAINAKMHAMERLLQLEGVDPKTGKAIRKESASGPSMSPEALKKAQSDYNSLVAINSDYEKKILAQRKDTIGLLDKEELDAYQKIRQVAYTSESQAQEARLNVAKYYAEQRKQVEQQANLAIAQQALSAMQGLTSQLGGVFNQYMTNRTMALDNEQYRANERIAAEYEAAKANIESTVLDEREKAEKLKALDEKRARDEKKLQEKIEKEKRKLARESAIYQKAIGITQSIINTSLGVTAAMARVEMFPFNMVLAGMIGALGAAQTALIAAQPLPAMAQGGLFMGPAIVAEKGREMALPLDGEEGRAAIREMAAGILDTLATAERGTQPQSGAGGSVYLDGKYVGEWINSALDNGQIVVPARVVR